MSTRGRAALLLAVLALGAGCGGDSGGGGGDVVDMEAEGFSPSTLTVEQGTTVKFENTSDDDKWPASNVHPTHQLYPGFDAGNAVLSGESYSFTFDRAGRWGYHDHLAPEIQSTIVVE